MKPLPASLAAALREEGRGLTILILRLGALGDILRTLPAVRLVRSALPCARILWSPDDRWAPVLRGHPDLDGTIALPRKALGSGIGSPSSWGPRFGAMVRFRSELRAASARLVLDYHGNLRSGVLGLMSGADVRIGYDGHQQKEGNRWFSTHRVRPGDRRASRMTRNLSLGAALGIPTEPLPDGGLPVDPADTESATAIVENAFGTRVGYGLISPGASVSQAYKKPPVEQLAAGARTLRKQGLGCLVVHGPGEEADARRVVEHAGDAARIAPPTSLGELAALLRGARMLIAGDTGPLHLACAVSCPVIGIYGPTDPAVNAPWGVPHEVVYPGDREYTGIKRIDRAAGGFHGLPPSAVSDAVGRLLRTTAALPDSLAARSPRP